MKPKSLQTSVSKRGARAESFWSAFWFFSLSIGACKSFLRLYLSHCPTLERFLSQFEVQHREREYGKGGTVGPGALRGFGEGEGKGRRVAPE